MENSSLDSSPQSTDRRSISREVNPDPELLNPELLDEEPPSPHLPQVETLVSAAGGKHTAGVLDEERTIQEEDADDGVQWGSSA